VDEIEVALLVNVVEEGKGRAHDEHAQRRQQAQQADQKALVGVRLHQASFYTVTRAASPAASGPDRKSSLRSVTHLCQGSFMRSRVASLIGGIVMFAAGCGNGSWVPLPMMGCNDIKELEKDAENFKTAMGQYMGPSACREAGGLSYAGEFRCVGEKVEVRCEQP
jgi:hypothetical protein